MRYGVAYRVHGNANGVTGMMVATLTDGERVAKELFQATGKPQFVCDAGWQTLFVTTSPKMHHDVVRSGYDATGHLDCKSARNLAFA